MLLWHDIVEHSKKISRNAAIGWIAFVIVVISIAVLFVIWQLSNLQKQNMIQPCLSFVKTNVWLIQDCMPDSIFITCITVQFIKTRLECAMNFDIF